MFTVEEIKIDNQKILKVVDKATNTKATLNLSLGGSIQELFLADKKIIEDVTKS